MQEAMTKIRAELGNDAVILNSRYVKQKGITNLFKQKKLEVVAAYDAKIKKKQPAAQEAKALPEKAVQEIFENRKIEKLSDQLQDLQQVVKKLAEKFESPPAQKEENKYSPEVKSLYEKMIAQDVDALLADEIAKEADKATATIDVDPGQVTEQIIIEKLGETLPIRLKKYKRNVILFLGPTGVGKTTTLVKLAGHFVAEEDLKVGIINTDTFRVAAKEQLKIYAEIMDIPLDTAYTPEELKEALKHQEDRELIFMDTAGRSLSDEQYRKDVENIIETCEPDEIFVTLSLTTGYNAFKEIIDNLSFVKDYKIVLTKLDEVSTWGNILNFADYAKKTLSYITNGQNIPDDIEQANTSKIAYNILK
jgi:flagellar biosynthesis protein FlhF